jgi:hypothetical protein
MSGRISTEADSIQNFTGHFGIACSIAKPFTQAQLIQAVKNSLPVPAEPPAGNCRPSRSVIQRRLNFFLAQAGVTVIITLNFDNVPVLYGMWAGKPGECSCQVP